jgi:Tfp pilus assembly protein PilV
MKKNIRTTCAGFSLAEMLVYVFLVSLIILALINIVYSFSQSYKQLSAQASAENTALSALERMERDIHTATSVDTGQSTLNTSPGVLVLTIGTSTTKFYTSSGELRVNVDGVDIGPLSVSSATVSSLTFKLITTTQSQAVKIEMTIQGTSGSATVTKKYRSTVILKNS